MGEPGTQPEGAQRSGRPGLMTVDLLVDVAGSRTIHCIHGRRRPQRRRRVRQNPMLPVPIITLLQRSSSPPVSESPAAWAGSGSRGLASSQRPPGHLDRRGGKVLWAPVRPARRRSGAGGRASSPRRSRSWPASPRTRTPWPQHRRSGPRPESPWTCPRPGDAEVLAPARGHLQLLQRGQQPLHRADQLAEPCTAPGDLAGVEPVHTRQCRGARSPGGQAARAARGVSAPRSRRAAARPLPTNCASSYRAQTAQRPGHHHGATYPATTLRRRVVFVEAVLPG